MLICDFSHSVLEYGCELNTSSVAEPVSRFRAVTRPEPAFFVIRMPKKGGGGVRIVTNEGRRCMAKSFSIPRQLVQKLTARATLEDRPASRLVAQALREFLDDRGDVKEADSADTP